MNALKKMLGMGLAVALIAGGGMLAAVSSVQAEPPAAKQDSKPEAAGDKKDAKQGEKPAEEKTRGFKKGQKAVETMGTMGKEKAKDETKP
jgi:hypothetical protein